MSLLRDTSGMVSWASIIPLDAIKTRIQAQVDLNPANRITFNQVVRELRHSGRGAFFAGLQPSIIRAAVVSATRFSSYELTQQLFGQSLLQEPPDLT
jgi:solute carrier family 25 (mitochondrial carnitine/acylcarnitine transporter), member 20/29